jgi:putative tryptophan/tyrosine transport system substrate-binding protein
MRRRLLGSLAAAVGLGSATWLMAQPVRVARLGVLHDGGRGPEFNALFRRLGERGWVEGRNLAIEFRTLDPDAKQAETMARQLALLNCDVILANSTPAALGVHAGAPKVPMVFLIGGDPVALGLVKTLQRPGGQATGYVYQTHDISAKQLALLLELAPSAKRIAVMFEAGNPSMRQGVATVERAGKALGLTVLPTPLRGGQDVDAALASWRREPVDGLLVLFDRVTARNAPNIASLAWGLRLPAIYGDRTFIVQGGVVAYGIDWPAHVVGSADCIARVLDGAKPADLPVQQPTRFELVVHLRFARHLGMTIPQSVLLQATEVIQ